MRALGSPAAGAQPFVLVFTLTFEPILLNGPVAPAFSRSSLSACQADGFFSFFSHPEHPDNPPPWSL